MAKLMLLNEINDPSDTGLAEQLSLRLESYNLGSNPSHVLFFIPLFFF